VKATVEMISQVRAKVDASIGDVTEALEANDCDVRAAIEQLTKARRERTNPGTAYPQPPNRPGAAPAAAPKREAPRAPKAPQKTRPAALVLLAVVALGAGGYLAAQLFRARGIAQIQAVVAEGVCVPENYQTLTKVAEKATKGALTLPELNASAAASRGLLVSFLESKQMTSADLDKALDVDATPIIAQVAVLCPAVATEPAKVESALGLVAAYVRATRASP